MSSSQERLSFSSSAIIAEQENFIQIRSPFQGSDPGCGYFAYRNSGELIKALDSGLMREFLKEREIKTDNSDPYHGLVRKWYLTYEELKNHRNLNKDKSFLQKICMVDYCYESDCDIVVSYDFEEQLSLLRTLKSYTFGMVIGDYHKVSIVIHKYNNIIFYFFQDSLNNRFYKIKNLSSDRCNEQYFYLLKKIKSLVEGH